MSTALWLPPGLQAEVGPKLPEGSVRLSDARVLKVSQTRGGPFNAWAAPDGLTVLGEVKKTAKHGPLIHVVVMYRARRPSWEDVRKVREAFFGAADVMIPFGTEDDSDPNQVHLWSMPANWTDKARS